MREIKFRAWDYGVMLYSDNPKHSIGLWAVHYLNHHEHLMQYTGLKDKNSVDIYEGDIVYYQFTDKDAPVNHVCTFAEDIARFGFKDSDAIWGVNQKDVSARAEVIGNVHENPELLEK